MSHKIGIIDYGMGNTRSELMQRNDFNTELAYQAEKITLLIK